MGHPFSSAKHLLCLGMLVSILAISQAGAQIGPSMPEPKPQAPPNKLTDTFKKIFKKEPDIDISGDAKPQSTGADDIQDMSPATGNTPAANAKKVVKHPPILVQPPMQDAKIAPAEVDPENPPVVTHPKLDDLKNPLGLADAAEKMRKLSALVDAKRFAEAKASLPPMRQWLVDATEAHISLYKTLNGVSSAHAQAELEKQLALEFAQLRDQALFGMGRIYAAEKDYAKAVKELTDVVKSQPRSQLGVQAYDLLQEIGFTEKLQLAQ